MGSVKEVMELGVEKERRNSSADKMDEIDGRIKASIYGKLNFHQRRKEGQVRSPVIQASSWANCCPLQMRI